MPRRENSMKRADLNKLVRILGLLGSDQPGERTSAALAAHRLVAALGVGWTELLHPPAPPKVVVKRVRDYDIDARAAADARMRQLKSSNDRLEKEVRALRRRLAELAERDRRRRAAEDRDRDTEVDFSPPP
jgi:hypothetical protein